MSRNGANSSGASSPRKTKDSQWSRASVGTVSCLVTLLVAAFVALSLDMQRPGCDRSTYNNTQLGRVLELDDGSRVYRMVVVTDLDHHSKDVAKKHAWHSIMKHGVLSVNQQHTKASVVWQEDSEILLHSSLSAGGRAMELSDLAVFNGHLVTVDDRTGILYKIHGNSTTPWVLLNDGAGEESKGFKGEWLTVKDAELWVGGLGKEWTTTQGVFVGINPMYIKRVSVDGCVQHESWQEQYTRVRAAIGIHYPGYMIHEAVQWSSVHRKWFFLPRRASNLTYTEADDEGRGTNYLLMASEDFSQVQWKQIGPLRGARGFSAFQFVPGSEDSLVVALKSEEKNGSPVASYVTVFNVQSGHVLLDEQPLHGAFKYEGIAFV